MRRRNRNRGRRRGYKELILGMVAVFAGILVIGAGVWGFLIWNRERGLKKPEELLSEYMGYVEEGEYEKMYELLDVNASGGVEKEAFISRNSAIYEGIEVRDLVVEITGYDKEREAVVYHTTFDTVAGEVSFENEALFRRGEEGYGLVWEDGLILPGLRKTDRVRVSVTEAKRGQILDRNDQILAGAGTASSVGIVPGKLEDRETAVKEVAELLEMQPEDVEKKLSAKWVKEDYFVPLKTVPKIDEIEWLIPLEPDEEIEREKVRQEQLLEIPGVMISDVEVRSYPLKDAAAHLVGYVQNVTAEDLEKHAGEGYTANSVIGRNGMEGLFEKELKGQNGCRIYVTDEDGELVKEWASIPVQHGQDVKLTIDAGLQQALYAQFGQDESCSVAMNPYTGEVLALLSTPSYDNNDFILGLSSEQWTALNEDEAQPMYNRFRQTFCPGSSFKPVTAAVGLSCGAVDPAEDYGNVGLSWQKDASWGSYYVTTLHAYEPVVLENALIYSDNIYFAKAALKIGAEELEESLQGLGFGEQVPFEIQMAPSQYSNGEHIETEVQLADSGYGQGQMLVNPLHLACIYTAFCNEGNMIKPYLVWQPEANAEYWIPGAFSEETAAQVLEGVKKVVNDPHGTGYGAHREDILLAGKTGTAEIKDSKEDTSGTELGWFAVFTPEKEQERPILLINMVEDVKGRGGSGYVVQKDAEVLESWFAR